MNQLAPLLQNPMALTGVIFVIALVIFVPVFFLVIGSQRQMIIKRGEKVALGSMDKNQLKLQESLKKVHKDSNIKLLDKIVKSLPNLKRLRYRLEMSDLNLNAGKYLAICLGIAVFVSIFLMVMTHIPKIAALFIGIIVGTWFPHVYLSMKINKKTINFVKLFPDAIELIVRGLRSGLPVQESFKVISEEVGPPISKEFALIAQNIKLGVPVEKALNDAAKRLKILEFDFFVTSLNLQRETGGNLGEILSNLANTIRMRFLMKMKVRAISSEARASAWIVGALPFAVSTVLYFANPGYLNPLFDELKGNIVLGCCFLSLGTGVFVMKKMATFEI